MAVDALAQNPMSDSPDSASRDFDEEANEGLLPLGVFLRALRHGWRLILATAIACLLLMIVYIALLRQPDYLAVAVIGAPANSSLTSTSGQALSAITGIDIGGDETQFNKLIQVLSSTRLAARLEKDHGVMKRVFEGWDEQTKSWQPPPGILPAVKRVAKAMLGLPPWQPPTPSALANFLKQRMTIDPQKPPGQGPLSIRSSIFAVSIDYEDRDYAITLLRQILMDADALVREDQLAATASRIRHLNTAMTGTQELYLRETLQQLLMDQERTLMTLRADRFYAFDMIDPPNADPIPTGPSVPMFLLLSLVGGGLLASVAIYVIALRRHRAAFATGTDPFAAPFPDPVAAFARLFGASRPALRQDRTRPAGR